MIARHPRSAFSTVTRKNETEQRDTDACLPKLLIKRNRLPWDIETQQVSKKRKLKKTVKFDDVNHTIYQHYTEGDLQNSWCSNYDYTKFKIECMLTLKAVNAVKGDVSRLDFSKISTRGLEDQIVRCVYCKKRKRRKQFIQLLLCQQEISRMNGSSDPRRLRTISESYSKDSREVGIALGKFDRFLSV
jgi:hypothetical protein